jgi:hypothetical protein
MEKMKDPHHECHGFTSPEGKLAQVNIRKATRAPMKLKHFILKSLCPETRAKFSQSGVN